MSQSDPFHPPCLVSPEGFLGETASLFQTSLMEKIRDASFTCFFRQLFFLALGLEKERGLFAFSPPVIRGCGGVRVKGCLGED